jgi:hypothetical protein
VTRTALLVAATLGIGTTAAITTADSAVPHRRVLFVGNSLTYTNDLPATVAAIARSVSDTMTLVTAAAPNLALIDHLTGGSDAVRQLKNSRWDVVVLQQGPTSSAGVCRDSLVLWTRMFDSLVRPGGGRTALFMTWPAMSQGDVWTGVRTSYQLAAHAVDGVFLPAGEAWHIALRRHPGLPLYGPDGFHPSPMGSYLAALEIYERLSDGDARTFTPRAFDAGKPLPMSADTIRWLQQAAHEANGAYAASPKVAPGPAAAIQHTPGTTGC